MSTIETIARAICFALGENPDRESVAINNKRRWQDFTAAAQVAFQSALKAAAEPAADTLGAVTLSLSPEQSNATVIALDTYSRLAIGQFGAIGNLLRLGYITPHPSHVTLSPERIDQIEFNLSRAKDMLGLEKGETLGIHHPNVAISAKRAWEIKKVLAQTLAKQQTDCKSPASYGLDFRLTADPAPHAIVCTNQKQGAT